MIKGKEIVNSNMNADQREKNSGMFTELAVKCFLCLMLKAIKKIYINMATRTTSNVTITLCFRLIDKSLNQKEV